MNMSSNNIEAELAKMSPDEKAELGSRLAAMLAEIGVNYSARPIPVSERLPRMRTSDDGSDWVLAFIPDLVPRGETPWILAIWNGIQWTTGDEDDDRLMCLSGVTHWMPLPPYPK